ncbi:endonuclease-reverse transcriptase domain-containing protein [Hirsutella rhossiliensis]
MAPASARASQHLLSSPAEARPNVSTLAAQQLPRPTSPSDTPNAAVAEGTQPEIIPNGPGSTGSTENAPVSIIEAATKIARDQTAAHDAKLAVFRAFSESFEQTAKQFTSGSHNSIAKQVATKFLNLWTQSLADLEEPPKPTYSSVLASGKTTQGQLAITASAPPQRKQQTTTRLQGRPPVAPPKEDLRVFVRLDADAPARNHERYAIRAHIAARVGIDLRRIPAAFPVNTGWAILASDVATRELLVQRQADWAVDLDATAVEISQKWHSYVVADYNVTSAGISTFDTAAIERRAAGVVAKPAIVAKNAPPSSSVQTALDPIARMTPNALPAPSAFTAWSGA